MKVLSTMSQPPASAAQPVICCVGESVSGQPTQFMIERAVASLGMDWRALSVEVRPEKFEAACQGMLDMGFKGLRLFSGYQQTAAATLAQNDPAVEFIGIATSGSAKNHRWLLWDHSGYAWLELMRASRPNSPPIFWLCGDSRVTRSLFVALVSLGPAAPSWLWSDAHSAQQSEFVQQFIRAEDQAKDKNRSVFWRFDPNLESLVVEANEKKQSVVYVTESKTIPNDHAELLCRLEAQVAIPKSTDFPLKDGASSTIHISQSDLTVAGEAYDFHRWTGKRADLSLLKDAYDEYCDFW